MNANVGVNKNKILDSITKRVKVPAITQREYYKSYDIESDDDEIQIYSSKDEPSYLDSDDDDIMYDDEYSIDEECPIDEECCLDDQCCCMEKFLDMDKSKVATLGIGVAIGALITCIIKCRK